ncbi:hypothetical protein [Micromonospora sp. NPDC004704]
MTRAVSDQPVAADPGADGATATAGSWAGPPRDDPERRARASQSFWAVAVGAPAIFSVLRLGVEAGGELQTTLLLVANVGPVNLVAAFVTTATRLVSTALVAVFAIGAVLAVSADREPNGRLGRRRPIFARWADVAPVWFVIACFGLALVTWQVLYLPLLLPALAATFQLDPVRLFEHRVIRALVIGAGLLAYSWLVFPTTWNALEQGEYVVALLFTVPPLVALFVAGPILPSIARLLASVGQAAALVMLVWAAVPVITTPVLPLTVTTVEDTGGTDEDIRGHVISVDDVNVVILQERGGVRYVPVDRVASQVLCPTEEELPRYRLRVRDFHIEDSLLVGLGRFVRPQAPIDAACRIIP